ncbi:MAG TPA: recombinase family protein [Xanthobacteraceae bacterium]|nr:recombinase family protein [Xanthobacteraceae bacterium]
MMAERQSQKLSSPFLDVVGKAGAGFKSLGDTWADTTTPHGRLMLTVLGGLAEFERELIIVRTGEGRTRAKSRGVKFGRRRINGGKPCRGLLMAKRKQMWLGASTYRRQRLADWQRPALSRQAWSPREEARRMTEPKVPPGAPPVARPAPSSGVP